MGSNWCFSFQELLSVQSQCLVISEKYDYFSLPNAESQ